MEMQYLAIDFCVFVCLLSVCLFVCLQYYFGLCGVQSFGLHNRATSVFVLCVLARSRSISFFSFTCEQNWRARQQEGENGREWCGGGVKTSMLKTNID